MYRSDGTTEIIRTGRELLTSLPVLVGIPFFYNPVGCFVSISEVTSPPHARLSIVFVDQHNILKHGVLQTVDEIEKCL
jgi:hypothetical protein